MNMSLGFYRSFCKIRNQVNPSQTRPNGRCPFSDRHSVTPQRALSVGRRHAGTAKIWLLPGWTDITNGILGSKVPVFFFNKNTKVLLASLGPWREEKVESGRKDTNDIENILCSFYLVLGRKGRDGGIKQKRFRQKVFYFEKYISIVLKMSSHRLILYGCYLYCRDANITVCWRVKVLELEMYQRNTSS